MKDGFIKIRCVSPEIGVADVSFNTAKIIQSIGRAKEDGIKILVFPELCVSAYTCADLFLYSTLISACEKAIEDIKEASRGKDMLIFVGAPLKNASSLYNCAIAICNAEILGVVPKQSIPCFEDACETRYFATPSKELTEISILGCKYPFGNDLLFECTSLPSLKVGCEIGSDLWVVSTPSEELCKCGATLIVNLSATSEGIGKDEYRRLLCKSKSASAMCAYAYCDANENESTTDCVFSSHNIICENGAILAESKPFSKKDGECTSEIDIQRLSHLRKKSNLFKGSDKAVRACPFELSIEKTYLTRYIDPHPFICEDKDQMKERAEAILTMQSRALATRLKASFSKCAVIGISGGLDSTLALIVTVYASDYLGWDRKNIHAITMPCFGTTKRTKSNATELCASLGVSFDTIDILNAVNMHFDDIGHARDELNVAYENAQARERTQILMDYANDRGGLVIGTGDLSEIALGWSTYNGDHISMYNPNCSIPKTLVRHLVGHIAERSDAKTRDILLDILDTPVSPELLPPEQNGDIAQKTEDLVGPYELHDFFLYNFVRSGFAPSKIYRLAKIAFDGIFTPEIIYKWLEVFIKRFFSQQFKRSCSPDGVKVGTVALSPRGEFKMPSDASAWVWLDELSTNKDD
ncbi:MAG: NAD(+) synthase [Clostridia bacterium]|nr:NAD(+) synthase [Clostridia bacterium]